MKKLVVYLIFAFGLAWLLQGVAIIGFNNGNSLLYTGALTISMFAPMAAAFISGAKMRELGWMPDILHKWKYFLIAWFMPAVLGIIGAGLYFIIFPNSFDPTMSNIGMQLGEEGLKALEEAGMSLTTVSLISAAASLTWAPVVNMLAAIGEEAGWRGVMNPILKDKFGKLGGRIISGIIWGAWHWPIMIFTGYEYGTGYWGEPFSGMIAFCIFTTAIGIIMDWLYDKSECIWTPALFHGAVNAFAGIPILVLNPAYGKMLILGPLMIGLISGIPIFLTAAFIAVKDR